MFLCVANLCGWASDLRCRPLVLASPFCGGGYPYLYVTIDKFTKWAEVEAVCTIPAGSVVKFIKGLVSRFGVPNRIITDNGSQFTSNLFKTYCANLRTQIYYASVAHPRSNGQAERANVEVLRGLCRMWGFGKPLRFEHWGAREVFPSYRSTP